MNPREYYLLLTASITDDDIRRVADCMAEHIGADNAVRIEDLSERVGMHERQVRDILATLVKQYRLPVCASSGGAGRWIAANEDERWRSIRDLDSRIKELYERREALLTAKIPSTMELNRAEARVIQKGLF